MSSELCSLQMSILIIYAFVAFSDKKDKDLIIQCEAFKEAKAKDEDELLRIYGDMEVIVMAGSKSGH